MGRYCPNCRAEYVEGWGTCSNCGVSLVDSLPPEAARTADWSPPSEPDHEDPFVPVWEGPTPQAEAIMRRIESAHIPVEFGEPPDVGHARVEVPRSYVEEVRDVLTTGPSSWPREVTDDSPGGFDWKPVVRIALVVVAVLLIVALVLM